MTLQITEQAGDSDVGRQRQTNEDSYVVAPPFYAVADGMGGAKAGEVASKIATDSFDGESGDGEAPEAQLERIAREANRRIYDLAASDESLRGMGTTLTAARVDAGCVSLGHVGDSRAYLLRDGQLEQVTRDHSLVAELERTGQITREAAEHHPQRSIITRALGPEPDVEVDTYTVPGRDGDLFLLCSDGLTSMLSDDELAGIARHASSLDTAASELIQAANQSGGKDNITVVLFRLGDDGEGQEEPGTLSGEETMVGGITAADVRAAARAEPSGGGAPTATAVRGRRRSEPIPVGAVGRTSADITTAVPIRPMSTATRRRPRGRRALGVVLALAALAAVLGGLYVGSRQVWFVGTNDAGLVALYRGLPYDLPFGMDLYEEEYASGVPARAVPRSRRERVLDHRWRGREDAVDLVRALERGRLDTGTRR